jgi:hypothetical protein
MGHETTAAKFVCSDHVVSELRWVRFSGFPFEWNMAVTHRRRNVFKVGYADIRRKLGARGSGGAPLAPLAGSGAEPQ